MKRLFMLILMVLASVTNCCDRDRSNVFVNSTVGFEIIKPDDWYFTTAGKIMEQTQAVKFNEEEYHMTMKKYATMPLVSMTKFLEPYKDLNPSINIYILPLGNFKGAQPVELIALVSPQFRKSLKDFKLVQPPMEVEISGIRSAYARINNLEQAANGSMISTISELWIVPRGDYFFVIGTGIRQDERNSSLAEIESIVKTVKIEPSKISHN